MTLTSEQIEQLYQFTKQHYVEWYDLQTELVDHLANDIEQIWIKKPHLTFDEAKLISFKKFGVFGFMNIVEKKQSALSKKYVKLIWNEFIQFFTIPKMIFTISYFLTLLFIIRLTNNTIIMFSVSILLFLFLINHVYKSKKQLNLKEKKSGKKWMFEAYISNLGGLLITLNIPFQILISLSKAHYFNDYLFISFIVVFSLIVFITTQIIPNKIRIILSKEYSDYNIS